MTVEMHKGESFYLCKDIDGPYEAICPSMHSAFVYHMNFPTDVKETLLICADCADEFEVNESKFRKSNK